MAAAAACVLAVAATGCSSGGGGGGGEDKDSAPPTVKLEDQSDATGGRVLLFNASTNKKLVGLGGLYAIELRGIDLNKAPRSTFAKPDYANPTLCATEPCEWSVLPKEKSNEYQYRAFLVHATTRKEAARSLPVRAAWTASPRPHSFKLLINGKSKPIQALDGADTYLPTTPGKLRVEAHWKTDARDTGYQVLISTSEPKEHDYAICSVGTKCFVPMEVPLLLNQEMSWEVQVLTTEGNKVASAFKVCLVGKA